MRAELVDFDSQFVVLLCEGIFFDLQKMIFSSEHMVCEMKSASTHLSIVDEMKSAIDDDGFARSLVLLARIGRESISEFLRVVQGCQHKERTKDASDG